jgi:hypothetical protein
MLNMLVKLSPLGTAATSGLLYKPHMIDEDDCGAIGGMKIGRGNRSTRGKPAPAPLCPQQIPRDQMLNWLINVYTIYTGPLSVQAQYSRLCPISSSFRYNSSLVTWTVVCLTADKFKPLILISD